MKIQQLSPFETDPNYSSKHVGTYLQVLRKYLARPSSKEVEKADLKLWLSIKSPTISKKTEKDKDEKVLMEVIDFVRKKRRNSDGLLL